MEDRDVTILALEAITRALDGYGAKQMAGRMEPSSAMPMPMEAEVVEIEGPAAEELAEGVEGALGEALPESSDDGMDEEECPYCEGEGCRECVGDTMRPHIWEM